MPTPQHRQSSSDLFAAQTLQGLTVLVLEDAPVTQLLLVDVLEWAGAHVILSITCQSALALLQQRHFDVILANLVLPDGSGYTLLQTWRQWERAHDLVLTPAIAVTAAVTAVSQAKATVAGFQSFVAKPYDFEHLFSAIVTAAGTSHRSAHR